MDVPVIHQLSAVVSHYKLLSYVCVFMAGKTQTNPAPVLWSIKLWLILPVMWKQRVYKMPSHNSGVTWFQESECCRQRVCLRWDDRMDCHFFICFYFDAASRHWMSQKWIMFLTLRSPRGVWIRGLTHRSSAFSSDALQLFWGHQQSLWLHAIPHVSASTGNHAVHRKT